MSVLPRPLSVQLTPEAASSSSATSTPNHKRLSLNTGPRPLHLASASPITTPSPASSTPGPSSAGLSSSAGSSLNGPPISRRPSSRRQSSISYLSSSNTDSGGGRRSPRSPFAPTSAVDANHSSAAATGDKVEKSGARAADVERPTPLTLVEKHADLLHFIAQKESKCLELRSQLSVHEAELLQLKRKWERIVARGFDRAFLSDSKPSTSASFSNATVTNYPPTPTTPSTNGMMLDGLRAGARFIAELSAPVTHSPTQPKRDSASSASTGTTASTTTTSTDKNSSISSMSSLEPDGDDAGHWASKARKAKLSARSSSPASTGKSRTTGEDDGQVLMVRDTGATPTMSPNPDFVRSHSPTSTSASTTSARTEKILRRRSRDAASLSAPAHVGDRETEKEKERPRAMERDKDRRALPPAPAIPLGGLGALGGAQAASWVGSVGRRWEELAKTEAFTKGQRRASTLLSDVSSSIAAALASPPLASAGYNNAALGLTSTPGAFTSSAASTTSTPVLSSNASHTSLLDDSDDADDTARFGSVMKPDVSPTAAQQSFKAQNTAKERKEVVQDDDDDEWNW